MPTWRNIRATENVRALDDVRETTSAAMQSQYAASPTTLALVDQWQELLDPSSDIDLFFKRIFDIYTAEGVGLDIWGRILQMRRTIDDPDTGVSLTLSDSEYRLLLLYKALANISASTAEAQNRLLETLIATDIGGFPQAGYVLEVDTMVIRWVLEGFLNPIQIAIFKVAGQLARGAGVGWELYAITPSEVFGFDGSEMNPFNQAPFAPDDALVSRRR